MMAKLLLTAAFLAASASAQAGVIYTESGTMQSGQGPRGGFYHFPLHAGSTITARWELSNADVSIDGYFSYRATGPGVDFGGDYSITRLSPTVYQVSAEIIPGATNFFNGGELSWSRTPLRFDPSTLEWGPVSYRLVVTDSAVPEPASWALMIAGFGLAGAAVRKRQMPAIV